MTLEHLGIVPEEIIIILDDIHLLESVCELPLQALRIDFIY